MTKANAQSLEEILTVDLFGETYKFKTDADPSEASAIVRGVVDEVTRAGEGMKGPLTENRKFIQLLVATLNIAKELVEVKKNHAELHETLARKSTTLIEKLGGCQP
ncbi:cell division protein ZapA [Desulfoluna sp.]|uniref:cell division protein ZapA n=1 Tax=Desulfoluna sp. TaxID=2045199 RepID=UPI002628FC3F|nr:cell division protein ZapA [Desulfoluna sp.]